MRPFRLEGAQGKKGGTGKGAGPMGRYSGWRTIANPAAFPPFAKRGKTETPRGTPQSGRTPWKRGDKEKPRCVATPEGSRQKKKRGKKKIGEVGDLTDDW